MAVTVYKSHCRAETENIASNFAEKVLPGSVIAMKGDLGAGKTCFAYGFSRGMGYEGDVNSPTFSIVNEYIGGKYNIYHFDMYRVTGWEDLYSTGYFDYLDMRGIMLIEWSENILSALPDNTIFVTIEKLGENDRIIKIED